MRDYAAPVGDEGAVLVVIRRTHVEADVGDEEDVDASASGAGERACEGVWRVEMHTVTEGQRGQQDWLAQRGGMWMGYGAAIARCACCVRGLTGRR